MTDHALEAAQHVYPHATVTRAILISEHVMDDGTRALTSTGSHGLTMWDALGMVEAASTDIRTSYAKEVGDQ